MLKLNIQYDKKTAKRVKKFINKYPDLTSKATREAASFGKRKVIKDTPVKTGRARRSFEIQKLNKYAYSLYSNDSGVNGAPYTKFLEYGTRAHGPKTGEYMTFPIIRGNTIKRWVRTKRVRGIRAYRMIQKNVPAIGKKLTEALGKKIRRTWGKR